MNLNDSVLASSGDWSVSSDGLQWILRKRYRAKGEPAWQGLSFVHSTRDVLARCMREKGCPPGAATRLLAALPSEFSPRQAPDHGPSAETSSPQAVT
jgi:hypothetical protein